MTYLQTEVTYFYTDVNNPLSILSCVWSQTRNFPSRGRKTGRPLWRFAVLSHCRCVQFFTAEVRL